MSSVSTQSTQISDFFGSYPDIDDPMFNSLIAQKEEFAELKPGITEPRPSRGGAYKHQKFGVRYSYWYNRALYIHDPGTGKSCIITHSAELHKNEYIKNPDDPTKIRRAIILVKGPALIENIRNEIVCKCTDRIYETEAVMSSINETIMKNNITRILKTWYDIMTYGDCARIINKFEREEDLEEYMSNIAIYVDEAHNIPTLENIRNPKSIAETMEGKQNEDIYQTLFRAFHKGRRNKIFLFTATPMNNSPIDIIPLINLILPLNSQGYPGQIPYLKIENEENFVKQGLEYFEKYYRGRISYIRAMNTGAHPQPMGVQISGQNTIVYPCNMSEFQYRIYLSISENGVQTGQSLETFYDHSRQISNFVFPNGDFGNKGFDHYVDLINGEYQFKGTVEAQEFARRLSQDDYLEKLSTKYFQIKEICKSKFPETQVVTDDSKGIVFVYFPDYVHGSGAIMLGLVLKANGYTEFQENYNIFTSTQTTSNTGTTFGPCVSTTNVQRERIARIPKAKRYVVFSSETPKSQISTILNTLNSYENRYGQYIQVIIGSRMAREGINIINGIAVIKASGSWNASSDWQAEERVFRSTSLADRLSEKRERLRIPSTEPVSINVEIYNLAAIWPGDANNSDVRLIEENSNTVDPQLYVLAERKDRMIRTMMRYLKQCSVDCYNNRDRNIRATDIDNSSVCDYLPCRYTCTGISEQIISKLDRSTKILYYSDEEIERASSALKILFSRFYSLKIEQIHQLLQIPPESHDPIFIDMAIEKMIRENTRVLDRMGFFGYLRESPTGVIYLEKDPFEIRSQPENSVYNSVLIGTQDTYNNSFNDYISSLDALIEAPLIQQLINTDINDPKFKVLLENLSLTSKVTLLELSLYIRKGTSQTNDFYNAIIEEFNHVVFQIKEPVGLLRETAILLSNIGKSRGRKPNPNTQPKIKKLGFDENFRPPSFDPNDVSDWVILHTLLNQASHDRTSYGAINKFSKAEGQLRILKISEGIGWRNMNQHEYIVYNTLIQKSLNKIRTYYEEQFSIYGIMLPPSNKLHIRDRESESTEIASRDARAINNGRICTTWLKPALIDILYRLAIPIQVSPITPNITRQIIINYLRTRGRELENSNLESFPDDKLIHYYQWYQSNFSREDICQFIKQYFEKTGRLLTGKMPSQLMVTNTDIGSINVGPSLTVSDYNQPTQFTQQVPSAVLPQFTQTIQPTSITPTIEITPQTNIQPPDINTQVTVSAPLLDNLGLPQNQIVIPQTTQVSLQPGIIGLQYQ